MVSNLEFCIMVHFVMIFASPVCVVCAVVLSHQPQLSRRYADASQQKHFLFAVLVDITIGLRVSEEEEVQGLDLSQHGEEGYYWEASA